MKRKEKKPAKESKKKYNFISNSPLGKDLFEGKSHERTANVICNIIKEDQFQVIGIDGDWGVGKSNLVKIVDDKLDDYSFFIYDVWGHQEDEQRRSLMVELTAFVSDKEKKLVADESKWEDKLKKLLSKQREVTTENLPYLSPGFILSVISIVWTPTALAFVDKLSFSDWLWVPALIWKVFFLGLPWLIVIGILLLNFIKSDDKYSAFRQSVKQALQETFQIYANKQTKVTKLETVSEYEPPVKAFQDWMSDIDNDLKGKKLVLVLDNFDRLPKQHILSVWSSVHVFFAEKEYKSIKVIVPFDRKHIKAAFKDLNGNDSFANDYINKTFDIVFRVAQPILSSWKVFFRKNWEEAFSKSKEEEYVRVEQAYETLRPSITPREIVDFINNCITLKLLDDSIPDRYIAVYLLCQEKILDAPLKAILDLAYLEGLEPIYSDDEEYPKFITALAYQINPTNALEVVYKKQLKDCLANNETKDFDEIAKLKVFKSIIISVVTELTDVRNPILVLDGLSKVHAISEHTKDSIWQTLYSKLKSKNLQRGQLDQYQMVLLKNLKIMRRNQWLKLLVDLLWGHEPEFEIEKYLDNLDSLEQYCNENNLEVNPFDKIVSRATSAENYKRVIDLKEESYNKYKIECNLSNLDQYLSELQLDSLQDAAFIKFIQSPTKLEHFKNRLLEFISSNKKNREILNNVIPFLKMTSGKRINLSDLLNDAEIYTLTNQTNIGDPMAPDLAAMRLSLLTNSHGSYQGVYNRFLTSNDESFHSQVAKEIEWYIDFDNLLVGSIAFTNPLMHGVIKKVVSNDSPIRVYEIEPILKNLISISNRNGIDSAQILSMLKEEDLEEVKIDQLSDLNIPTLELLNESDSKIASSIITKVKGHYSSLDKGQWEEIFEDVNSEVFDKLKAIDFEDWNTFAYEEYNKLLLNIADTATIENEEIVKWLMDSFDKKENNKLDNIFQNIRDRLIRENSINPKVFYLFIAQLFKYGKLESRVDDVLRVIFNTELLDDVSCVQELNLHSEALRILLKNSSRNIRSSFRDGLQARAFDENVLTLSNSLGFRIKEKSEGDDV